MYMYVYIYIYITYCSSSFMNSANSYSKSRPGQDQVDKLLANITASTSYDALSQCDIVVEAQFEGFRV